MRPMVTVDRLDDGTSGPPPILEILGVSKQFGSTQALDDVSLTLHKGEIHALLGENGAGKSTLIKVMTGVEQPDAGQMAVDGAEVSLGSALHAQDLGIAAIYQEPNIFPDLSVAENIFISHRDRGRVLDRRAMRRDAERSSAASACTSTRTSRPAASPSQSSRRSRSPRRCRCRSAS